MKLTTSFFCAALLLLSGLVGRAGTIPGDLNSDGIADRNDLVGFLQAWREAHSSAAWSSAADMNADGHLTYLDASLFANMLLTGPSPKPVYRLYALGFGPYYHGNPTLGDLLPVSELKWLVDGIAPYCARVHTYASSGTLSSVAPYAKSLGLGVWAACQLTSDSAANETEITALLDLVNQGAVDLTIVGTETLQGNVLPASALISYINRLKGHGVPVTTNDTWSKLFDNPDVMAACDVILANIYPFWEKAPCDRAVAVLNEDYNILVSAASGKQVWIGETGWPSAGPTNEGAIPSPANAAAFFLNFVSWARARGVPYSYFEMVDEPWKTATEGDVGAHWGLWESTSSCLRLKTDMILPFRGQTVADNWSAPGVVVTHLPTYNSSTQDYYLLGAVTGVDPSLYAIAVYIYVNGGWWTKPTFVNPVTLIGSYGTWSCDIDTGRFSGGHDELATVIAAFLIPKGYTPPAANNAGALDPSLLSTAVASQYVNRTP
jgi:exo-beta-1,3-glucanase (GH17 family)